MEGMKWLGVSLAALACMALGFGIGSLLGGRAKALNALVRSLRLLSMRVIQLHEPMEEALEELSGENEVFPLVLSYMADGPELAWEQALRSQHGLSSSDRAQIVRLMTASAGAGREEQERIFAVGLNQLAQKAQEAQQKNATDAKLYRTLGMLAGLAIVVLSI